MSGIDLLLNISESVGAAAGFRSRHVLETGKMASLCSIHWYGIGGLLPKLPF